MCKLECQGCQHDDGNGEHCFFWHIAVSEVTDWECGLAKTKSAR
jgi:hypothetical protein